MDSIRALVYLSVLTAAVCQGQMSTENRLSSSSQEDQYQPGYGPRDLAAALESLLDGTDRIEPNRIGLSVEKKATIIPRCDVGERCAMKHGPRIGRLCDCLRGTACNTFFLRCY